MDRFFSVVIKQQTYMNMLYNFLSFPLGLIYFIVLITGISVSLGLSIVIIGIPLFILLMATWLIFAAFERFQAIYLLNVKVPPMVKKHKNGLYNQLAYHFSNPVTWWSLLFLLLKFPLGLVSFVFLITGFSVVVAFLAMPITFNIFGPVGVIDNISKSIFLSLLGILLLFVVLHMSNFIAWIARILSYHLLGDESNLTRRHNRH